MVGWIANIEAAIWAAVAGDNADTATLLLLELIGNLPKGKNVTLMYRDNLLTLCGENYEAMAIIVDVLAQVETESYLDDPRAIYLKTEPDVVGTISNNAIQKETSCQVGWLFEHATPPYGIYLVQEGRLNEHGDKLKIIKDKKVAKDIKMSDAEGTSVAIIVSNSYPKLVQHKHYMQTYSLGGNTVSPFTAYDKNDEMYAKKLLQTAYENYNGKKLPADELYVWDKKYARYVRFMHSGNNEYHGHDEQNMEKIPDEVKKIYGVWKSSNKK